MIHTAQEYLQLTSQLKFSFLADDLMDASFSQVDIEVSTSRLSSDAGLLPIYVLDQQLGHTQQVAEVLKSARPDGVQHTVLSMLRQRLFGLIAGYEDQNDHDTLRRDPVFQLIAHDRLQLHAALASQPTLSRFENAITPRMLLDLRETLIAQFLDSFTTPPTRLTLDIDAFDDTAHGNQQLTFFHGFYDQTQYLPIACTCAENDLVLLVGLRHGTCHASLGVDDDIRLLVTRIRERFPAVEIHVRGDSGFGVPVMYDVCEELGVTYTFGYSMNTRVQELSSESMKQALSQYNETGEKARLFSYHHYQAHSWPVTRQLIVKSEVHARGTNQRAIITNRIGASIMPAATYDEYVERGESENRNKELKRELFSDRLSCHRFMANYFRLVLSTLAHNLVVRLRQVTSLDITPADVGITTDLPTSVMCHEDRKKYENRRRQLDPYSEGFASTWRHYFIKVAGEVTISSRRVLVKLSSSWPYLGNYFRICHDLTQHFHKALVNPLTAPDFTLIPETS